MLRNNVLMLSLLVWLVAGCTGDRLAVAELVVVNADIITMDPARPEATAIATKAGKIIAVGSRAQIEPFIGSATELVDAGGNTLMPSINDAHAHPILGGLQKLYECNFPFDAGPADVVATIESCIARMAPQQVWLTGGQWTSNFFVDHNIPSPRQLLDAVSTDKAVVLADDSFHNAWVNTRALELLGIDGQTPAPEGMTFVKNSRGELTGLLYEAFALIRERLPAYSAEQYQTAALEAVASANRFGVTGIKDASAERADAEAFYELDRQGRLNAHIALSLLIANSDKSAPPPAVDEYIALRDRYRSELVNTSGIKLFLDGVPTASRTAALLQPYVPEHRHSEPNYGQLHVNPEQLAAAVTAYDRAGFTVKIHAAGDRSIRVALDAIEQARQANGFSGLYHELAHAAYIDSQDIPRFNQLQVVAGFTPYIWFPSAITDSILAAVPAPRNEQIWPARQLLEAGATMLAGSDWPSAVPDMNPWPGIEALVTRRDPSARHAGALWPEQALSLEQALTIYTVEGAKALGTAATSGSLEVGKRADFILLHVNLASLPVERIGDIEPARTYFNGELVYSSTEQRQRRD